MNINSLRLTTFLLFLFFYICNAFGEVDYKLSNTFLQPSSEKINNSKKKHKNSTPINTKIRYAIVTASALNLRKSPSIDKNVLRILPKGIHLLALSHPKNGWIKVKIPHDIQGWVAKRFLKLYLPKSLPYVKNNFFLNSSSSILEASIRRYMDDLYSKNKINKSDKLSSVVQDLSTGELIVSIRSRKSLKSASTIKVPILQAYMIQRFRGIIKESTWHRELIEEMIRYSSNPSTNTIIKLLGGTHNIQELLDETQLYNELSLKEYFPVDGRSYQNKISAADLNQIFEKIWLKLILDSNIDPKINSIFSEEMLYLLGLPGHTWLKDRIKAGTCFSTNKSVKIWDKTGFVKGANGNAGIVEIETPHGKKAYSIVLFMERENYKSIKGQAKKWFELMSLHMRRISEMTYAFFSNRYESHYQCGHSMLTHYIKLVLKPPTLRSFYIDSQNLIFKS